MALTLSGFSLLILSILVLYLGRLITRNIKVLGTYNIPEPVTGGLVVSLIITLLQEYNLLHISFDLDLRNLFLLMFFSTVGLSARFSLLISGGRTLLIMLGAMFVFLFLQNFVGIGAALALGEGAEKGLLAGSIAMAGGHGTAITWGIHLEQMGFHGAQEFGLAAATLGLILGGLIGGPMAQRLISRHNLKSQHMTHHTVEGQSEDDFVYATANSVIRVMLKVALAISSGLALNSWLYYQGVVVPNYLPVLLTGICIANVSPLFKIKADIETLNIWGEVSIAVFIAMSLMSLQLSSLAQTAVPLLVILALQCITIVLFVNYILFPLIGKDYDAAVISSGFIGSGLGATPVGMANIDTVTHRFGMSPKALLIIPLLGSFFTDVMNAVVLRLLLTLPIF